LTIPMQADSMVIAPQPQHNEVNAIEERTRRETAKEVLEAHSAGLQARQQRDLISEKLLLHIDGSGDLQWADILYGTKVEIPRLISEFRKTENLLRLVVDNAVAHHTTMPLRYFADAGTDREARDRAMVDSLWMNHLAYAQDLNSLFADALYMAMPAGFCPVHAYWREDPMGQYEPIEYGGEDQFNRIMSPKPGMIDCWLGNPFDTVFDRNAKRGSMHWFSYGRVLPAEMVRRAFDHIPGAAEMEGTTKIPSASQFQRIARDWNSAGFGIHGSPVIEYRRGSQRTEEELIILLCREVLPGVSADWPYGRLQIVAVPGAVDLRRKAGGSGHAILLADQPLPAGDFSATLFYSHKRQDDIHGKPWVEDIDQLQVDLNIALSKRWELINRMIEAPIVAPGGALAEDMTDLGGYNILEIEPSMAAWRPRVMEWPTEVLGALNREVDERRQAIYTGGGYQAVSRGEAPGSRTPYKAIVALQQADSSIHGPVNQRFRRSAVDFAVRCWKQMKMYGDVPWLIGIVGDEYAYLAEPYIDNTKMSDRPPNYKLVNAFGPSPEARSEEILALMALRGADGQPFMTTEEARRQYPNPVIFDTESTPKAVARRRAKTVAAQLNHLAKKFRAETGMQEMDVQHPWVVQAAQQLFGWMEAKYPRLRDDDLDAHLAALSEITQDETADPIARMAATQRQNLYYEWQASMSQQPGQVQAGQQPGRQPQSQPQQGAR